MYLFQKIFTLSIWDLMRIYLGHGIIISHHRQPQAENNPRMIKYIEEKRSTFSEDYPPVLHNFVTKEVMTEKIRRDLLTASEIGKEQYEAFQSERIVKKA